MHHLRYFANVLFFVSCMAAYGMEERDTLQQVRDWLKSEKTTGEFILVCSSKEDLVEVPCLEALRTRWSSVVPEKKEKMCDDQYLAVVGMAQSFLKEKVESTKQRLFTDIPYAGNVLKAYKDQYQTQAFKSKTGLFCKNVLYEGVPLYLLYDSMYWYLFGEQFKKCSFHVRLMLKTMQKQAVEKGIPAISICSTKESDVFLFAGLSGSSYYVLGNLAAIVDVETCTELMEELRRAESKYSPLSIQPQMGYGTRDKKNDAREKCLPQWRKLPRNAVPGGKRNRYDKP